MARNRATPEESTASASALAKPAGQAGLSKLDDDVVDALAIDRRCRYVHASEIPRVDERFVSLERYKSRMRKVVEDQRAEVKMCLLEAVASEVKLDEDLGPHDAPAPGRAAALLERFDDIRLARQRAAALRTWANDTEDLLHHDVMSFLLGIKDDLLHAARKRPEVTDNYPHLMALFAQRGAAVVDGRARAAALREQGKGAKGGKTAKVARGTGGTRNARAAKATDKGRVGDGGADNDHETTGDKTHDGADAPLPGGD